MSLEQLNEHALDIVNNKGTQLPSTGGIGTTIFYVVGGVLVLAAIILLVTKKRMSE
jgi:LPXTG-motif cell wall-anchored protein